MSIQLSTALRLAGMFAASAAAISQAQTIYYVDDDAPQGGSGNSWQSPFRTLDDALAAAAAQVGGLAEVRIAGGTYVPNATGGTRASTFACEPPPVHSAVSLWLRGGYAGFGAPAPNAREIDAFRTTLSGDRLGNDSPNFANYDDNCFHVVTVLPDPGGETSSVGFDGLTIRGGAADGADPGPNSGRGGGVLARNGISPVGPAIVQCRVVENRAALDGGGIYSEGSWGRVFRSEVLRNQAGRDGGGLWISCPTRFDVADSVIGDNRALHGGGLYVAGAFAELWRNTIAGNVASGSGAQGGGICDRRAMVIANCLITRNTAPGGDGGGLFASGTGVRYIFDSTWAANSAENGGAVAVRQGGRVYCTGLILWSNQAQNAGAAYYIDSLGGASAFVRQCDVQGGQAGVVQTGQNNVTWISNITEDPRFVSPSGPDGDPLTWADNDLTLRQHSPCIDRGYWTGGYLNQPNHDLTSNPRQVDDMWAMEFGQPGSPPMDMGAFERQGSSCPADCDNNGSWNVNDFICFLNRYATGNNLANCDQSTIAPVLNVADFICFINSFAAGCP